MKNFKIPITSVILVLITAVALITGCQKNAKVPSREEISLTPESIPKVLYNASFGNLRIPNGTTTEVLNNGSTVKLNFPKGIYLVGTDSKSGEIQQLIATEYTCTGDCTKGCDVFYAGGQFGCSACDPNTIVCTGKAKSIAAIQGKGFVNFNAGISFIKDKKEAANLFAGPDILLTIPKVREAMKGFNLKIHGTETPDFSNSKQFREVGLNLFGCLVTYMVPSASNRNSSNLSESVDELLSAVNWSCRCDAPAGSSGCTKDSGIGYKKCTSGACTSCTMIVN